MNISLNSWQWTVSEVGAWLQSQGLGKYAARFAEERIDGGALLALTEVSYSVTLSLALSLV